VSHAWRTLKCSSRYLKLVVGELDDTGKTYIYALDKYEKALGVVFDATYTPPLNTVNKLGWSCIVSPGLRFETLYCCIKAANSRAKTACRERVHLRLIFQLCAIDTAIVPPHLSSAHLKDVLEFDPSNRRKPSDSAL
jgi:hypothetical protein